MFYTFSICEFQRYFFLQTYFLLLTILYTHIIHILFFLVLVFTNYRKENKSKYIYQCLYSISNYKGFNRFCPFSYNEKGPLWVAELPSPLDKVLFLTADVTVIIQWSDISFLRHCSIFVGSIRAFKLLSDNSLPN